MVNMIKTKRRFYQVLEFGLLLTSLPIATCIYQEKMKELTQRKHLRKRISKLRILWVGVCFFPWNGGNYQDDVP